MPTYEYHCTKCGRRFDLYQSFADDALEVCTLPALDAKGSQGETVKAAKPSNGKLSNVKSDNGKLSNVKSDNGTSTAECGGPVRKVFSSVGISFKGSGFYRNDSRAAAANGDSKLDSSEKSSGDSSTDGSTSSSGDSSTSGSTDSSTSETSDKADKSKAKSEGSGSASASGKSDKSKVKPDSSRNGKSGGSKPTVKARSS